MKIISTILLFIITFYSYKVNAQGGANCSAASSSPVNLPFSATNQTNCGFGDVYTSSNTTICGNGVYMDGEDILYAFTPTISGLININVTSGSSWVGLFLYQGCPSGGLCVANSTSSSGNQSLSNIFVNGGVTYYVVVDKTSSPTCINSFNITISAPTPAPTPTVQDCLGAIAVCQNVYSEANAYSGTGNIPTEINSGPSCLGSGEKNDVWYTFTTQTAGNVCFTIDPNVNSDDYDWAVYDLTSNSCSDIYGNAALEVSCNYSGVSGNTGPNGLTGDQNEPCIPVQSGETYVVNVSQFSPSTNGYTINFGASTASIFDNVAPALQAINSTITCGMTSLSFNLTENVLCSGILASDFSLVGPNASSFALSSIIGSNCNNGASQDRYFTISVTPAIFEPGTYSLCINNSSGSISDLCGNSAISGCLTFDVVYPTALAGIDDTITCSNLIKTLDGTASSTGIYNWLSIGGNIVSGQNTLTPQVNQTGFYVLEVNTNDCISRDTIEIFQDNSLPIVLAGNDTSLNCVVDTIQLDGFVSGSNIVYYWTGPSFVSGDSTLTPIIFESGIYTLTATDTVNSCQLSSTVNIVDDRDLPYIDAGISSNLTCMISSVVLDGSGSINGSEYTYQWTDSSGVVIADSTIASTSVPGVFTFTIVNTTNSCVSSENIVVNIDTIPPIASAGADTSLNCATITGVPIDGTGSQAGMNITYQWNTPNGNIVVGAGSNYALVNAAGTYIITVTNTANSCVATDTMEVLLDADIPVVDAGTDTSLTCLANIIQLNGSATGNNLSYNWTGPSIVSGGSTLTPTINGVGTYVLTVVDTVNNCQNSNSVVVTDNFDLPVVTAGFDSTLTCLVTTVNIDGTGSATSTDITYEWTTFDGSILTGSDSIIATTSIPGTYTLTVFNTLNGCSASDSVVININNTIPTANAGADATINCTNPQVTIGGSSSPSGVGYLWTTPDGNIVAGSTTIFASVNAPGTYTITVTDNTNGCVNTDDVVVFIDTVRPIANAGSDMIRNCYNPTVNLDGTGSSSGANITYLWSGNPTITNGNTATPTISGTGNYTLTVINTTNGCSSTDVADVDTNFTQPGSDAGVLDTLCSGKDMVLTGTTTNGDVYVWITTNGSIVSGESTLTPTIDAGGTYTLITTNTTSGCSDTSNVFIQETFVSAIISADPTTGQMPLTVNFMNMGIADSSFWDFANGQTFGDTNNMSIPSPVIYETQGSYVVTLTAFNGPCSVTTRVTIEVIGTSILIVPNVFTPNGDGKNDVFEFIFENITELNCVIFNRWGKQVAEITAPDKSWDGKNGSDGTYFYVLKAKGMDGVDYNLKGTVTLIR